MIFVTLANTSIRFTEDVADALKHVGLFMLHKIFLKYIHIYVVHLLVWIVDCTRYIKIAQCYI